MTRLLALPAAFAGALVLSAEASAYAVISPQAVESKELQQFTLSVPTEKEGATTTIELAVPAGFSIHSFEPAPPWKLRLRKHGSGQEAGIEKVTWFGGNVPTGQNAVFRFIAFASDSKAYRLAVRQTYSDGTVVEWSGPDGSRTPAAVVRAHSSGGASPLEIAVLVVAAGGVLFGLAGHLYARTRRNR